MIVFTQKLKSHNHCQVNLQIPLTATQRTRTRQRLEIPDGKIVYLRLSRGMVLKEGDLLLSEIDNIVARITAQVEPVLTVTSASKLDLMRAAYHLGNRHVAVEITPNYLRLSPDPVLSVMLKNLGLEVRAETVPFYPEVGAYYHNH